MRKIGILIYDDSLVGGAEKVGKKLAHELSSFFEIHLISVFNTNACEEKEVGYRHYILSKTTVSITKNIFKLSKKLKEYMLKNNIEVLMAITAGMNTIAIMSTYGTNIKTIYCEHSNLKNRTYGRKHVFRQYVGAKYMDKVVTLTEQDKQNFEQIFKTKKDKLVCIYNWYEPKCNYDTEYNIYSKKIITVGRLAQVKGYDMLVNVAMLVKEKHPEWHWDIYGDGEEKENILNNIKKNCLEDFVTLKGNVSNIEEVYNKYSIYVLTSYYEGIPLVLLEAQRAKLPIVAFNCQTGPAEIVENENNGFLVECYDISKMAEKINYLIENADIRTKFSNLSNLNNDKFDKNKIINKWKELIDKL